MRTISLGIGWLCLGLSLDAWSLSGQQIEIVGPNLLKRVRRGWMWNQFVLQEEYTGSDYQYIGKLKSDQDYGNGLVKYVLSGEGAGSIFVIDENNGDLHATRRLDREEKAFYILRATVVNKQTGQKLEPETEFTVKLHDINDNEKQEPLIISKEDVRDNVVSYNDEGGGEEDTQAFDIGALRHPDTAVALEESTKQRRDIIPTDAMLYSPRRQRPPPLVWLHHSAMLENDCNPTAPPYDSLATYAYEGEGLVAESLSSLGSVSSEAEQDYHYLSDWGPRFRKLAELYGAEDCDFS
uniref:Cadherin 6 n=1 Tax=Cyclopterus lumpus TaxID=8103 RepID=A0A8C3AG30_CYCLU